jgi:hypothetical protein
VCLEGLFDLLRILLWNTLFEDLWHRLDKLFGLDPTTQPRKGDKKKRKKEWRTSMRVRLGTRALTSLMIFGLEPASNDSSFTLKIVFSFGLEAASSAAASSAPAAGADGAAAPAAGRAISWMFRRVCEDDLLFIFYFVLGGGVLGGGVDLFTLRRVTRSAAWSSVSVDMSSTSLCRAGSEGASAFVVEVGGVEGGGGCDDEGGDGGGGGEEGDADEDEADAVAVASARTRSHATVLCACAAAETL